MGLYTLVQSISGSLHLEAVADTLLTCTRQIVACDACALFLPDEKDNICAVWRRRASMSGICWAVWRVWEPI